MSVNPALACELVKHSAKVSETEVRDKGAIIIMFSSQRKMVILLLAGLTIHIGLWEFVPEYVTFWTQSI
jgi:hypothetical protein